MFSGRLPFDRLRSQTSLPLATAPRSSLRLNTSTSIESLPKTALGATTKTPTLPPPALKPRVRQRRRRNATGVWSALTRMRRAVLLHLDPQFDYSKFGQRNGCTVSIDSRVIGEVVNAGSPSPPIRSELFLSVLSPVPPAIPRRLTHDHP